MRVGGGGGVKYSYSNVETDNRLIYENFALGITELSMFSLVLITLFLSSFISPGMSSMKGEGVKIREKRRYAHGVCVCVCVHA